jgi:hypothetical protein
MPIFRSPKHSLLTILHQRLGRNKRQIWQHSKTFIAMLKNTLVKRGTDNFVICAKNPLPL